MKASRILRACFLLQIANCKLPRAGLLAIRAGQFTAQSKTNSRETASGLIHPSSFILHPSSPKKAAFSILEVILALAILTGAMAVLGELGRLGFQNARATQDLTKAQLLCESKMAEYTSGITTPSAVSGTSFDAIDQDTNTNISWVYSVEMETIDSDGLIALRVTVTQNLPGTQHPTSFSLSRWILDSSLGESTDSTSSDTSGTSTTGGTTTSTSGTGTSTTK
jgi:type II secretory pathway pseudopilin PulG